MSDEHSTSATDEATTALVLAPASEPGIDLDAIGGDFDRIEATLADLDADDRAEPA